MLWDAAEPQQFAKDVQQLNLTFPLNVQWLNPTFP